MFTEIRHVIDANALHNTHDIKADDVVVTIVRYSAFFSANDDAVEGRLCC